MGRTSKRVQCRESKQSRRLDYSKSRKSKNGGHFGSATRAPSDRPASESRSSRVATGSPFPERVEESENEVSTVRNLKVEEEEAPEQGSTSPAGFCRD